MSIGNESTIYLRGLEVAELKEEDMPMVWLYPKIKAQYKSIQL